MTVGSATELAEAGTLVWAPAGVPHGVAEALEHRHARGDGASPRVTKALSAGQP